MLSNSLTDLLRQLDIAECHRRTHNLAREQGLNSSMLISVDQCPGLSVASWISNRTDYVTGSLVGTLPNPDIMLRSGFTQPLGEFDKPAHAFRTVLKSTPDNPSTPSSSTPALSGVPMCNSWDGVSGSAFDDITIDKILIRRDGSSSVAAVPALRI